MEELAWPVRPESWNTDFGKRRANRDPTQDDVRPADSIVGEGCVALRLNDANCI